MCYYHYPLDAMGSPHYRNVSRYDIVPILKISGFTGGKRDQLSTYVAESVHSRSENAVETMQRGSVQIVSTLYHPIPR